MPKIDLDINKLDWIALARIAAPILAPIVLAGAWIFLARTNKKANYLSGVFALVHLTTVKGGMTRSKATCRLPPEVKEI